MYLFGILCLVVATAALPVLPEPPKLPNSAAHQDSKIHTYIQNANTASAPLQDEIDNEEVKKDVPKMTPVVYPPPPQLPPFDYSILKKQKADQKQKYEDSLKQKSENSKKEKKPVISEKPQTVEVTPNPETLSDSKTGLQDLEVNTNIPIVTSDSAPVADKKDIETVKNNIVKIPSISIPPPPELPLFDYSNLRKLKSDQNSKSEYSKRPAAEKSEEEKEPAFLDQEKPVAVKVLPNPATLQGFVTAAQEPENNANIQSLATIADKKDDEDVKHNKVKMDSLVFPPPPELPPFDYSILRKQKADHNLKSEYSTQQSTEKETVILDLEKTTKVEERPNPETNSVTALPVSKERTNTLKEATDVTLEDKKKNKEGKNVGKIASDHIIPPPPELSPFDYSILRKKGEQKQKLDDFLKPKSEKTKKDKEVLVIKKPVEIKVEEPKRFKESKLVGDSTLIEEAKPVEESKPKEELKKEPVKHSEDIPVAIKVTIPPAPFLSKLISNYSPESSFGFNWPLQKPTMSRPPRIIYPKFNGIVHTN